MDSRNLFPSYGPSGYGGGNSLFPSYGVGGGNNGLFSGSGGGGSQGDLFGTNYTTQAEDAATLAAGINEQATIDAGSAPIPAGGTSAGVGTLGTGSNEFQGHVKAYTADVWKQSAQWDDEIVHASEYYGVPADRLKATMMIESGGVMYDANGAIVSQPNDLNGHAYGLMQITVTAGPGACSHDWCGWGDGKFESKQTGVNHNVDTPDGNLMMGARILREYYDNAKALYPNAPDDQLWDMASSAFFVGNNQWQGGDSYNGTKGVDYKSDLDTLIGAMGQGYGPGQDPASTAAPKELINERTGNGFVDAALTFLHSNYVLGAPYGTAAPGEPTYFDAQGRPTAFDCSGFVSYLAKTFMGVDLSTGSHEQWADTQHTRMLTSQDQLQPGDLIFYDTKTSYRGNAASHVGIFVGYDEHGDPWMINAMNEDAGVVMANMNDPYWTAAYMGAKRIVR